MDIQTLLTIVIQCGALGVLAIVLNEVNKKIDRMIDLNYQLITKLIDRMDDDEKREIASRAYKPADYE